LIVSTVEVILERRAAAVRVIGLLVDIEMVPAFCH
jgi:hypothetical protein